MKIGYRLVITLVFVAFVLPYLVMNVFGGKQSIDARKQLQEYDQFVAEYDNNLDEHAENLYATVDNIGIRDPNFKKCLKKSLADFARIPASSTGHLRSVTELPRIRCYSMGITDLKGIEKLTVLSSAELNGNDISSLLPLTYHPSLKSISLEGSSQLQNLEVLLDIKSLEKVRFPNLTDSYCYEAIRVHEKLRARNSAERRPTNAKNIRCRGKYDNNIGRLIKRKQRGEKLSYDEKQQLKDYEVNKSRS